MPRRPLYLSDDTIRRADDLAFQTKVDEGVSNLRFPQTVEEGIRGLRALAFGDADATEWTPTPAVRPEPLPIVVSDRPEVRQPQPSAMPQASQDQAPNYRVDTTPPAPGIADTQPSAPVHAPIGQSAAMSQASAPASPGEDLEAYTRRKAASLGIDPQKAVEVGNTEGGFRDPTRQNTGGAPAFGPFQMYIGGPSNPGLGDELLARGVDPRKPENVYASIDHALEHAAKNGWGAFQGAAANGIGNWDGIGQAPRPTGPQPTTPMPAEETPQAQRQARDLSALYPRQDLVDRPDKWDICGPIAVIAAGAAQGKTIGLDEAIEKATAAGWRPGQGMAGPQSQVALMQSFGIKASTGDIDLEAIKRDTDNGNVVLLSSPGATGHYFVVERVTPDGRLDLGNSALALRASGGRQRLWSLDELRAIGPIGAVDTAIYVDNPKTKPPSLGVALNAPEVYRSPTAGGPAPAEPPPDPTAGGGGDLAAAAGRGTPDMMRMSLGEPAEDQPIGGGDERDPRRFYPTRNIEPLGPAMRGVSVGPAYQRPGTRNMAVPGEIEEWTESADLGEGLYPSGWPRNSAVPSDDDLIEETPKEAQQREAARRGSLWDLPPTNPGVGYEGRPLPGTIDERQYPWTGNIPQIPQTADGNQRLSYRGPLQPYDPEVTPTGEQPWQTPTTEDIPGVNPGQIRTDLTPSPSSDIPTSSDPTISDPLRDGTGVQSGGMRPSEVSITDPTISNPSYTQGPWQQGETTSPLGPEMPPPAAIQAVQSARAEPEDLASRPSGLLPVWDAAQNIIGYVQENARPVATEILDRAEKQRIPMPWEPVPIDIPGVPHIPNPVGIARAIFENTEPAAGVPRKMARMREINARAAADQGRSDFRSTMAYGAVEDPAWRAANPELAAEFDELESQVTLDVGGMAGELPRIVGQAAVPATRAATAPLGEVIERGRQMVDDLGTRVTEGWNANQGRVAALDAQMARQGSTVAPGTFGLTPGQPARRPTVEVLREQLDAARGDVQIARQADDIEAERAAIDRMWALDSQLADAVNARLDLEPRIVSDVGQRIERLPLDERTADDIAMRGREVVRPGDVADIGGPSSVIPETYGRMNVTPGISSAGSGILTDVSNSAGGGVFGAASGAALPAETEEERRQNALTGAAVGMVAGPAAGRLIRGRGGALATPGITPGAGGYQSTIHQIPGVRRAIQASQARAARMQARGVQPLSPIQWTGKLAESVGYSSMIGIRTATVNFLGNLMEPAWALPKEAARGASRAITTGNTAALREPGEMFYGASNGLWNAGGEMIDALLARGRYVSPDQPRLSEQTVNPIAHAIATIPEVGGRVFSGLPDALFGSIARGAGEARAAAQIATDAGLKGPAWKQRVTQVLADRDAIMAGTPPVDAQRLADAQQAIRDGGLYAKDQTFQNEVGAIGRSVEKVVRLGNAPVLGKLVTPFFNTPWNMKLRAAERTPLGLVMNTHNRPGTTRTTFDKNYDALVGTVLIGGMASVLGSQGRITGSGPDDDGQKALLRENGWMPQSTLVRGPDGQDYYVQNNKFGIYGALLNTVGEVHDALTYGKRDATEREQLIGTARRFGKMFENEAQLRGLSDLLMAITDPGRNAIGYAGDLATRLTPYAATARDISTARDDLERETDRGKNVPIATEITQRWQSGTGQRSDLPVKEGLRGPQPNEQGGIWAFFPKASRAKHDPVVQMFLNANVDIPRERTTITVGNQIPERQRPPGQSSSYQVPLTPEKARIWENARNRELVRLTEAAARNPLWEQMAPGAQQQLLQRYVEAAAKTADTVILTRPDMQAVTNQAIRDQQTKAAEQYRTGTR